MRLHSRTAVIVNVAVLFISFTGISLAWAPAAAHQKPTWFWVMDTDTSIGIVGASVDLGRVGKTGWKAHFVTGPAGRVLVHGPLPNCSLDLSYCRVTLEGDGQILPVKTFYREVDVLPYPGAAGKVRLSVIYVSTGRTTDQGSGEWSSSSPSVFRAYITG
jgi:hypothetical protein